MNYNQVINKCNPTVINSILGDSLFCQVATQTRSFLEPCKLPMADCQAFSVESAKARVKVLVYHLLGTFSKDDGNALGGGLLYEVTRSHLAPYILKPTLNLYAIR